MMLKRLVILLILFAAPPALADADRLRDVVVRELRDDGYTEIRISRTWLGRMRFVANRPGARREIVINPATGAILRDYVRFWRDEDGTISSGSGGSGSGGEEDDDDDDDDDDDESDNSGPGNSNDD